MRRKLGWFPLIVAGVLLVGVVLEIWFLLWVIGRIGFLWTLLLLLVGAVVGMLLLRREGAKAWQALMQSLTTGHMPQGRIADAALVLLGGLLLVAPGFLSDAAGLLLIAPVTRPLVRSMMAYVAGRRRQGTNQPTVIEGEVVPDAPNPDAIRLEPPKDD